MVNRLIRPGLGPVYAILGAFLALTLVPLPLLANGFEPIRDRSNFLELVEGRKLTNMGVTLNVTGDGMIRGRALGRQVTGEWNWSDGFFCRSLFWGNTRFPDNCQWVGRQGDVIRFQSDRGTGEHADLTIR